MKDFFKSEAFVFTALMFLFGTVFIALGFAKLSGLSILLFFLGAFFYSIAFLTIKDFKNEK